MTDSAFAFGLGVGTHNGQGEWLEVFYPAPVLAPSPALVAAVAFVATQAATHITALASIAAAVVLTAAVVAAGAPTWEIVAFGALAGLVIGRHADNLRRLRAGTEHRSP